MGFKTFGNYFNEQYDLEKDADKRMDALLSLCKDLKDHFIKKKLKYGCKEYYRKVEFM